MSVDFPIHAVLPILQERLAQEDNIILEAEPGAGKTTVVPLALLSQDWLGAQRIIMLEPRRLAAKAAASRLAEQLGEPVGQTIGYQIRSDGKQSSKTKILVVTEGILTRMLQDDPSLEGIGLVIFDEFHERNLHSDLGLALCLQARQLFREDAPLKLLVMSATLDSVRLSELLNTTPIKSAGRSYPIDYRYGNLALTTDQVIDAIPKQIQRALVEETGSILVFLPGMGEINRVQEALEKLSLPDDICVLPLHGSLSIQAQSEVIKPAENGRRKVVLATSIAQTSLTIDGIRVVIDSGLSRESRFDPKTATSRLHTRFASQAETIQRAGRAGRLAPGVCYRWWSQEQQSRFAHQSTPQIEQDDLSHLVLELALWGVSSPDELEWVTPPPSALWQQAKDLLVLLGLIARDDGLTLTDTGEKASSLPLSPRLCALSIDGAKRLPDDRFLDLLAALADDSRTHAATSDIGSLIQSLKRQGHQSSFLKNRQRLKSLIPSSLGESVTDANGDCDIAAIAFPDRIARRQKQEHDKVLYKLSNGRMAFLPATDANSQFDYLIVTDLGGHQSQSYDRIYRSIPTNLDSIQSLLSIQLEQKIRCEWDSRTGRLIGETQLWLGKLNLSSKATTDIPPEAYQTAACQFVRKHGWNALNWDDEAEQTRQRISFANKHLSDQFPDMMDSWLLDQLETWLAPYLTQVTQQAQLKKIDIAQALLAVLPWELQQQLDSSVPTRLKIASGDHAKLTYHEGDIVLRAKLQALFGETKSPTVLGKTVKIELLSPAQRPLAVTQDLAFFWREVYPQVRKEMRGKYVKHPWPEDPMSAEATTKTNRALRSNS